MHKKILWILIVLWTTITWITQWYTLITWEHQTSSLYYYNIIWIDKNEKTYRPQIENFDENKFQIENLWNWNRKYYDYLWWEYTNILRLRQYNYWANARNRIWNKNNEIAFLWWNESQYAWFQWGVKPLKYCTTTEDNMVNDCLLSWNEDNIQNLYNMSLNISKIYFWTYSVQQNWWIPASFTVNLYCLNNNWTVYCVKCNNWWYNSSSIQQTCEWWQEILYQKNMETNFQYLQNNVVWESPYIQKNNNDKPVCTNIQTQIMLYGYKYNTWLCYSNDKEWTWSLYTWERVTVTHKSIFEIFTWFDEYKTRRSIYENSCHAPYTQEYCLTRMQGNIYASEIFTKIDNAWLQADKVYQYCYLQLNFTEEEKRSTTNCEALDDWTYYAPWIEKGDWTPNPIEWLTDLIQDSAWYLPLPENWSVFDEILPEWILSREDVALDLNFMKNMVNWARKFMILFTFRKDQPWIIPPYITSLILLFIFYKMLKK